MSDIALQTRVCRSNTAAFHALAEMDLQIRRNSVHSIIGPNGAGKTTLFHALTGRVRASSGRIELDGHDITGTSDDDRVRLGIARSFQVTSLFPNLTLRENLRLAAQGRTPWGDAGALAAGRGEHRRACHRR
jgi:branched-chain amino acid transport system ATP-binding protein